MGGGEILMSTTIDERVVQMRFDNKQFEQNVSTTMGTVRKLDETIKSLDHTTGLENLSNATKGISLDGIANSVEAVKDKFSALSIVGITALMNISNQAIEAGKKLVNALTIEPIKTGFNEYELKMGSIQTIMASTGESLETVNGYLNELNKYSDKTIYSFSDMTQNIGKFTNAGVKLEDAVAAIKGISNEAAVSGANANEAARAMYNFAQALSAGYVKLIDWKSIENANMATVEFKNQLLDTALALGTVTKHGDKYISTTTDMNGKVSAAFNATSNFNDSLSAQWMTTDVLTQTLQNYSVDVREMSEAEKKAYEEKLRGMGYTEEQIKNIEALGSKAYDSAQDIKTFSQMLDTLKESAQSGWAESWELIFGNFEEAKSLWTAVGNEISNILQKQADERNQLLRDWADNGGQAYFFDAIKTAWEGLKDVISEVKKAFENVFPPVTADTLKNISINLAEFAENLRATQDQLDKIRTIFQGVFSAVDIFRQALSALSPYLSMFGTIADGFLTIASTIAQFITRIDEAISRAGVFKSAMSGVFSVINGITNAIGGFDIIKTKVDNVSTALQNSGIEWSKYKKVVKDATDEEISATKNAVDKEQQIRKAGAAANLQTTQDSLEDQKKAVQKGLDDRYKMQQKAYDQENKLKKKAYDQAYKDLQRSLDAEYKARQKELDTVYKDLQKSLNEEVKAAQEANKERQELVQKSYDEEVKAFKKATNEKIGLINEEYLESIKLIDEEKYNRLKAIDDQIKAINDQAEAEEKARKQTERDNKIAELNNSINTAKSTRYRKQKEQELAEYLEKIKQEELAEERKETIARLNEEKDRIQEEADLKAEEARDKRDQAIETVQEESEATLSGMAEAHEAEMEEMRKAQEEQIEAMREANSERLAVLKESQSEELSAIREKNSARLSELKEFQNDEMALIKEAQKEQLDLLKENNKEALKSFQGYQQDELDSFEEISDAKIEAIEEEKKALVDLSDVAYTLRKMDLSTAEGAKKAQELLQEEYGLTAEDAKKAVDAVNGLADANERIVDSATKTPISEIMNNVANAFSGASKAISEFLKNTTGKTFSEAINIGGNLILGFAKGIGDFAKTAFTAIEEFAKNILAKIREVLGIHSPSTETQEMGGNLIEGLIKGIAEAMPKAIIFILEKFKELINAITSIDISAVGEFAGNVVNLISSAFGALKEAIQNARKNVKEGFDSFHDVDTSGIDDLTEKVSPLEKFFTLVFTIFEKVKQTVKEVIPVVASFFGSIFQGTKNMMKSADLSDMIDLLNSISLLTIAKSIGSAISNFGSAFKQMSQIATTFDKTIKSVNSLFNTLENSVKSFEKNVKAKTFQTIAISIALLAASLIALSFVDQNKLLGATGAISALFVELNATMSNLSKIQGPGKAIEQAIAVLLLCIGAVLALRALSKLDTDNLLAKTMALGGILAALTSAVKSLATMPKANNDLIAAAGAAVILAIAVNTLAKGVKMLGEMEPAALAMGLIGVEIILKEIQSFSKQLDKDWKALKQAGSAMKSMAIGLILVAAAVKMFGSMDPVSFAQGMIGMSVSLLAMVKAFQALDKIHSNIAPLASSMLVMAIALGILSLVVKSFGSMEWEDLAKGLIGMGVSLAAMVVAFKALDKLKGSLLPIATSMLVVSAAMLVLSDVVISLGNLSWENLVKGLVGMGAALAMLVISLKVLDTIKNGDLITSAAAIMVMALSLTLLTPALLSLSKLSLTQLGVGLLAIGGALAILIAAAAVCSALRLDVVLLAMGAGIALIGAAVWLAGTGMTLFAGALLAVAGSSALCGEAIGILGTAIAELIPMFMEAIGAGIVGIIEVIGNSATAIGESIKKIIESMLDVMRSEVPSFIETGVYILKMALTAIDDNIEFIIEKGVSILKALLSGIRDNIGEVIILFAEIVVNAANALREKLPVLIQAAWDFVISFIDGVTDAIETNFPRLLEAVGRFLITLGNTFVTTIGSLITTIKDNWPQIKEAAINFFHKIWEGLTETVPKIISKMGELLSNLLQKIKENWPAFKESAKEVIKHMIIGLGEMVVKLGLKIGELMSACITKIKEFKEKFKDSSKDVITGFIDGIKAKVKDAVDAIANIGQKIIDGFKEKLGIHSPSTVFEKLGEFVNEGFIGGIMNLVNKITDVASTIGENLINGITSVTSGLADAVAKSGIFESLGTVILNGIKKGLEPLMPLMTQLTSQIASAISESPAILGIGAKLVATFAVALLPLRTMFASLGSELVDGMINGSNFALVGNLIFNTLEISLNPIKFQMLGQRIMVGLTSAIMKSVNAMIPSFTLIGTGIINGLTSGMTTGLATTTTALKSLMTLIFKMVSEGLDPKKFESISAKTMTGMALGFTKGSVLVMLPITEAIKLIINSFNKLHKDILEINTKIIKDVITLLTNSRNLFGEAGDILTKSFIIGLTRNTVEVNRVFNGMIIDIINVVKNYQNNFKVIGSSIVVGLADGMRDRREYLRSCSEEIGREITESLRNSLGIHSPSKEAAKIGEFFDEGLISGIKALSSKVGDTAGEIGTRAVETLQSTLKDATDMFDGEFAEPTIRPVLDLTDISRGTSQISQMLDTSGTLKMAADVSTYNFRDLGGLMNDMIEAMPSDDNTDVIDAINDLNTNMVNVMSTLGKLQVVLDTGTMVGELVNPIDQALGFNSVLNKRGVR